MGRFLIDQACEFDEEFNHAMLSLPLINEINLKRTTMTVLIETTNRLHDHRLNDFKEWFATEACTRNFKLSSHRKFHNCMILSRTNPVGNNISVKVFSNGKLHLTGVKTIEQAVDVASDILSFVANFTGEISDSTSFTPQLINYRLKVEFTSEQVLCLKTIYDFVTTRYTFTCLFNNEHHPGVRIKFDFQNHVSTVLIFESGSVLINAVVSAAELVFVYTTLMEIFERMHTETTLYKTKIKKRCRDKSFSYKNFL